MKEETSMYTELLARITTGDNRIPSASSAPIRQSTAAAPIAEEAQGW